MKNIIDYVSITGYKPEVITIGKRKNRPFCSFKTEGGGSHIQIFTNIEEIRKFLIGCDKTTTIKIC